MQLCGAGIWRRECHEFVELDLDGVNTGYD